MDRFKNSSRHIIVVGICTRENCTTCIQWWKVYTISYTIINCIESGGKTSQEIVVWYGNVFSTHGCDQRGDVLHAGHETPVIFIKIGILWRKCDRAASSPLLSSPRPLHRTRRCVTTVSLIRINPDTRPRKSSPTHFFFFREEKNSKFSRIYFRFDWYIDHQNSVDDPDPGIYPLPIIRRILSPKTLDYYFDEKKIYISHEFPQDVKWLRQQTVYWTEQRSKAKYRR